MADIGQDILRGRALGRFAALFSFLAIFMVWYSFQDHSSRTKIERSEATVLNVKEMGVGLRLATAETVTIHPPSGIFLRQGEVVPVIIETYESGNRLVLFDRDRWATGGR